MYGVYLRGTKQRAPTDVQYTGRDPACWRLVPKGRKFYLVTEASRHVRIISCWFCTGRAEISTNMGPRARRSKVVGSKIREPRSMGHECDDQHAYNESGLAQIQPTEGHLPSSVCGGGSP